MTSPALAHGRRCIPAFVLSGAVLLIGTTGCEVCSADPMQKLPQAVHELPGNDRGHGVAKLGGRHAVPLVVLIRLVVVEEAGDVFLMRSALLADELGGDGGCQDARLPRCPAAWRGTSR